MKHLALISVVLAAPALISPALTRPALAETATDPEAQLMEGYLACALGTGDADMTTGSLGLYGWTSAEDSEMGLINFQPGAGDSVFAYMSLTPDFCHIESTTIGTTKAAEVLDYAIVNSGLLSVDSLETDDQGCAVMVLSNGVSLAITSGGNDPVCTDETSSGVRFFFGAPE